MTAVLRARFEKPGPASPAPSTARKEKAGRGMSAPAARSSPATILKRD
jgi:hypothetical protein